MLPKEKKENEVKSNTNIMLKLNSSFESDKQRKTKENCNNDERKRESSEKFSLKSNATTKSFKSTRKKEDSSGQFSSSHLSSQFAENKVPLNDVLRFLPRRDGNKTDSISGHCEETGVQETGNITGSREPVLVRETRTSRLRAASKTPISDTDSSSLKSAIDSKKPLKERTSSSVSPSHNSLNRKNIDKSHTRKSHLNRSHTSEGVYNEIYTAEGSNIRRRHAKKLSLEPSSIRTENEKYGISSSSKTNSIGNVENSYHNAEVSSDLCRSSFNIPKKCSGLLEKYGFKTTKNEEKLESKTRGGNRKPESSFSMRESKPDAKNPTKFGAGVDHRGVSLNSENFCVRNSAADKIKPIDVTTRAEILTASTLKMINRLDEINNKSKKTQGYIVNASFNDVQKKALPSSTVIVSNCKGSDSIGSSGESRRAEVQKVPLSDNSNTKSSPWCTRKVLTSMRGRLDAPNKSTLNSSAGVDVVKADSNAKAEANKPSILKNKLIHSATPIADSQKSKPVSILKRKSLSQDETQSSSPPVTFSPSALKKEKDSKKQGILKKRRSLDENEVLRKRSGSPDANFSDFKSILKNERRSSMEELRRRSHSPDSTILQGILKRKFSKEEETEENLGSGSLIEPQGILKRKSLPQPNCGQQHVKIYDSIVAAAAGGIGEMQISESVRPILKKKSSSEEHSASDVSPAEVPKSILKKKTNADGDETEEKPKKPILKSSKTSSFDLAEDVGKRCQNLTPATFEPEPVKPILKRENSRSKLLDDFESGLVFRRTKPEINDRPHSSSDLDSELSAIFLKRRSLESQPINFSNFDSELFKTKISSLNELFTSDFARNSLPVAEKANNLEKFLKGGEDVGKENKISLSYFSPKNSLDVSKSTNSNSPCFENFNSESTSELSRTKAISKKFSGDSVTWQASEIDDRESPGECELENQKIISFFTGPTHSASSAKSHSDEVKDGLNVNAFVEENCPTLVESIRVPSDNVNDNEPVVPGGELKREFICSLTDSNQGYNFELECRKTGKEKKNDFASLDSCAEKMSGLNLKDSVDTDAKGDEDLFQLKKSGCVSSVASIFQNVEGKSKIVAEEEKIKKMPKGINSFSKRRQEKKLSDVVGQRFHTQPVSLEEVEQAVQKRRGSAAEKGTDEVERYEDERSTMSYSDRIRLFESTAAAQKSDPIPKVRGTRFRTQPITTVEVETAKNQRFSNLEQSTFKESPHEEGMGPEKQVKKVEKPSGIDAKQIRSTGMAEDLQKLKGILKNINEKEKSKDFCKKINSNSDLSDEENEKSESVETLEKLKKMIRKPENDFVSELKGVLKQPAFEKKLSPRSKEILSEEKESVVGKNGIGLNGDNSVVTLHRVGRGDYVEKSFNKQKDENSPGSRGPPKYLQNEGIARRINNSRNNSSIVKSQSHSAVSSVLNSPSKSSNDRSFGLNGKNQEDLDKTDEGSARVVCGLRRSTTQPFASSDGSADDDMSGATIQQRLARLKKNGELSWQKRKSHVTNVEDELSVITAGNYLFRENCLPKNQSSSLHSENVKGKEEDSKNSILADRLGKLDAAKDGWKKRIQPSDAVRFSVEGKKLGKMDSSSPPSVSLQIPGRRTEREKRSPKARKFRSKQCNAALNSMPSSPLEKQGNPITRALSAPGSGKDGLFSLSSLNDKKEINGPVVTVPKNDDETFTAFFSGICSERTLDERLDIRDEDLDVVTQMKSSQLLVQKRNIKAQRRRATVRNPLKALATRLELQEYTEIKTGVAQMELKRMKIEKGLKNSNLAIEALAGLASQEDFTAITLKKASEGGLVFPDAPYKDLMLLQIKGRRHVQTRLIEPVADNINAGDCFILVTPNKVFQYVGEFANVIERSRSAEISLHIQQKGDLGCTAESVITIGETGRATRDQVAEFWKLLGGKPGSERGAGNLDEDEVFESRLVDTNMVYELVDDELVPDETFWGSIPKIEILDPNKVLVFDFGSEFYVWNGKNVSLSKRKIAVKLAKELWEEGFDYLDCALCPLTAASFVGNRDSADEIPESAKAGPVRPSWALFAKISQNMETVLFREKFLDWPDYSRIIGKSKKDEDNGQIDGSVSIELTACDPKLMVENVAPEPDLVLEGSHLGRGVRYFDEETRRCSEIATKDVTVWHISEYDYSKISSDSMGQFHMEDSYVVRWHYTITVTGRELSGQPSKHLTTGRDRYAYFCWQGQNSPINDKGAAACLTVELDKEHGPQLRVAQGYEPPAFLNLFEGRMVVHSGRRHSEIPRSKWRLFICRGETESESVLVEVPCSMRQLRSIGSFVLVNKVEGQIIIWHGWKSCEHTRKVTMAAVKRIQTEMPSEFEFESAKITIREELEGSESRDFLAVLGSDNRKLYYSLLDDESYQVKTPRLFHLTSVSGEFHFSEIASPYLSKGMTTPFPFLQSDLYSASQPALFLLDASSGLWLWQGWWEDNLESDRGSGNVRFQAERRAAMSTVLSYCNFKYPNSPPEAYLIWAGLEPLIFTNQFPFWTDRDDVAEINIKDGKKPGEMLLVKTELESLTQSFYPLSQLQNRPLPDGVNPTSLEDYLKPHCFQELFGLDREEFFKMPSWKKKKLKQEAGLF